MPSKTAATASFHGGVNTAAARATAINTADTTAAASATVTGPQTNKRDNNTNGTPAKEPDSSINAAMATTTIATYPRNGEAGNSLNTAAAADLNAVLEDVAEEAAIELTANSGANPNNILSNNHVTPAWKAPSPDTVACGSNATAGANITVVGRLARDDMEATSNIDAAKGFMALTTEACTAAASNTMIITTHNNNSAAVVGGYAQDDEMEATSNSHAAANAEAAFTTASPNNNIGTTAKPPRSYPRDLLDVHVEKAITVLTETVADIANASLENPSEQATARRTPHFLDTISKMAPLDIPRLRRPTFHLFHASLLSKNLYNTGIFMWTIFAVLCKTTDGLTNGSNKCFSACSIACPAHLTILIQPFGRNLRLSRK